MALRRIFSQDSDFQEKMFAKQVAVMKGQAWNVVETLKTADHGPLELTRRTRVCVWDDLVDVPVAIPMRVPSAEMRRRREMDQRRSIEEEEMDISTVNALNPKVHHDLLGPTSPGAELPNPNRFNLSRNNSSTDSGHAHEESGIPKTTENVAFDHENRAGEVKSLYSDAPSRPVPTQSKTRLSFEAHLPTFNASNQRRRYSFSARRGSTTFFGDGDGDDLEGDLGYAAAQGMEGHQRKVIVERLESVKSKHPVFTCC